MMMQTQTPVPITAPTVGHASNIVLNHPILNPSNGLSFSPYPKVGKDTTWTKLFVGGLPYETTDKELREFFEEFGDIEEAVVIVDRNTGKSKGYGFVTMSDTKSAARAVQDPNPSIQGRRSNVNYAFIGAKHQYASATAARAATIQLATDAYSAANGLRYHAYMPTYGATPTGATASPGMLYQSPLAAAYPMLQTGGASVTGAALPVQPTAAHQGQPMLGAYTTPAYDYSLMQSTAGAAAGLPHQYFYPQMVDASHYMAMSGLQATTAMTAAPTAAAPGAVIPAAAVYPNLGATSAATVSAAVTTTTPALPPAPSSYQTLPEQR